MAIDQEESQKVTFLDLPFEIRCQIYALRLKLPDLSLARHLTTINHLSVYVLPPLELSPALLAVNRQIHEEATHFLYTNNTFSAHRTMLTQLPFLLDPARPIISHRVAELIQRWYLYVRLDVDPRWSHDEARLAFSGAKSLEVEAGQAMFGAASVANLRRLEDVRGVHTVKVHGSIPRVFAEWLEDAMRTPKDGNVEPWEDFHDRRSRQDAKDQALGQHDELHGDHSANIPAADALAAAARAEAQNVWSPWQHGNRQLSHVMHPPRSRRRSMSHFAEQRRASLREQEVIIGRPKPLDIYDELEDFYPRIYPTPALYGNIDWQGVYGAHVIQSFLKTIINPDLEPLLGPASEDHVRLTEDWKHMFDDPAKTLLRLTSHVREPFPFTIHPRAKHGVLWRRLGWLNDE